MSASTMFRLSASKRAVIKPRAGADSTDWPRDEEGFNRRWPNGKSPDIGVRVSHDASHLIDRAFELNEAQLRSGFLDWLYYVDVDAEIHQCDSSCPTRKGSKS